MRLNAVNIGWSILYLSCMLAVVGGMRTARRWSTVAYGTDAAQSEWQDWRSTVASQATGVPARESPVRRDVPRSVEPPALVLMRDYFVVCLVFCVVLCSALFVTAMVALRGALRPTSRANSD